MSQKDIQNTAALSPTKFCGIISPIESQQAGSINVDQILTANVFANINPSNQTVAHCGINQNVKLAQIV